MLQILYISTARSIEDSVIDHILAQSRRNNQRDNITGLLLYNGYRFLQTLEGSKITVERAYNRIRADPRHRAIALLSAKEVGERQFGSWNMAYERLNSGVTQSSLIKRVDDLVYGLTDPSLQAQFTSYVRFKTAS